VLDDGGAADQSQSPMPAHRPLRLPDVRYGGWNNQAQQQQ
jgi:hypothetical protein